MKKLFVVRNTRTNNLVKDDGGIVYYENKMTAKESREVFNSMPGSDVYVISKGPDHMGKHGSYGPAPMRRQPKRKEV